jgi:acetyltransferase-like isoleucine patch superfamily enzyme
MSRNPVDRVAQLSKKGAKIGKDVIIHESAEIIGAHIMIGDSVQIGPNTMIFANHLEIGEEVQIGSNCTFRCNQVLLGDRTQIGNNNDIQPFGLFRIGETSHIGNQTHVRGREVTIGDEVFITNGFRVGGGGRNEPEAILKIGDRCTMHNNFINLAKPVSVGNDVGFSPEAIFITHGYWQSVLEGYSASYAPITIHDWVIIGMRAIILPGVEIGEGTTIGAGAVVSRSLPPRCVAAGIPARVIKSDYPSPISEQKQDEIMKEILQVYVPLLIDKGFEVKDVKEERDSIIIKALKDKERTTLSYFRGPKVPETAFEGDENILLTFSAAIDKPGTIIMNLRNLKITGHVSLLVHDLRDFLRRYGIRFYGYGFFQSLHPQIATDMDYDKLY